MKKIFWITALVVLWLLLVVRAIPAQWGLWAIDAPLQVEGVSGTLWSGSVANAVLPFQDQSYALGELRWQLSPWSLLTLNPCIQLESEFQNQSLSGEACVGMGGKARFNNVIVNLPADLVQLWLPVQPLQLRGELIFRIDELAVDNNRVEKLSGKGRWDDAYYNYSLEWTKLGALAFDFKEGADGGVVTQVMDVEGPLKLNLQYQFSLEGTYDLRGDVIAQPNTPQEIVQLLMAIADKKGENHYYVEWVGS